MEDYKTMFTKMRLNRLLSKVSFTVIVILVMIIIRYIPLPDVNKEDYIAKVGSHLDLLSAASGASLSRISIASLGLSPWMSAMILMRLFLLGGQKSDNISERQRNRWMSVLVLVLSIIQGLGISLNFDYGISTKPLFLLVLQSTIILVSGSFVLMWFANLNSSKGFGGLSMIILTNIVLSRLNILDRIHDVVRSGHFVFVTFLFIWTLIAIFLVIVLEKSEYKIKINRIEINNKYVVDSYIPLKLNISGGMAFMYSFSVLMIPQYFMILFSYFFPNSFIIEKMSTYFSTLTFPGVILYMCILFGFCLSFAFVNVDVLKLSEQLRNSGDFIDKVRPGKSTKRYLKQKVTYIGVFNGIVLTIFAAIPMLLAVGNALLSDLATLVGMIMMISSMILTIIEEIRVIRLVKGYNSLFTS